MLITLGGEWLLAPDPDNVGRGQAWWRGPVPQARPTPVPGIIQGVFPGYHGVAWYWREFDLPAHPHPEGRCLLRCWAVDYLAEVWVNGVPAGGHEGGETPFVLDITEAVRPGAANQLAVRVLNPGNEPIDGIVLEQTPHRNKFVPPRVGGSYDYGGILEPVEVLLVPAARVADVFVRPDLRTGALRCQLVLRNATARRLAAALRLGVGPACGGERLEEVHRTLELEPGDTPCTVEMRLAAPRPWDLQDPFLYRLSARLESVDPGGAEEVSVRCGFRDFRVDRGYFRLNGRRLFVRSTHTGNHAPLGQVIAPAAAPDLLRRDLLYAKTCGYNTVRFIAGMAHPYQLDLCDEIGLMVYEESLAGWCLVDSPEMAARFDRSVREMVRRDRNHPCVTVWGLLNETGDGAVFRHARASLPLVRSLDDSRLVLLGSGRWDGQWDTGSVSNPDSGEWEPVWGAEGPGAPPSEGSEPLIPAYKPGAGDVHAYPQVPHPPAVEDFLRTVGEGTRPVFLSEYGIGSLLNAVRELRWYEQSGARPDAEDAALMRGMAEAFAADWQRWGFDGVYPFPEDMLRQSQRLHARQRLLGFDLVRANPQICGFNLTGMLDHGMTGEGVWTFWREWKPGAFDALCDGWAPLRWCLFSRPLHGYLGRPLQLGAVLADEDVLRPGEYPVHFRLSGPQGIAWEERRVLRKPTPPGGQQPSLALPALEAQVTVDGSAGEYTFAACALRGAAPAGGRLRLHLSAPVGRLRVATWVALWGVEERVAEWLRQRGVECVPFQGLPAPASQVILVGSARELADDEAGWRMLVGRMSRGACVVFASPQAFQRGEEPLTWLPLAEKGT
ncbi:MAG: glycoside hydrolase family 2 TIM barrel-domain containing protein, partial [Candidatus Latescibacterota bacterium]